MHFYLFTPSVISPNEGQSVACLTFYTLL